VTIAAALGYVIGIIVFAVILRIYRKKIIRKHMEKAGAKDLNHKEGNQHD